MGKQRDANGKDFSFQLISRQSDVAIPLKNVTFTANIVDGYADLVIH